MSRFSHLLRRIAARLDVGGPGAPGLVTSVGEITPCVPRRDPWEGRRLNLMLPSINRQHYFGGIHTAVLVYQELCRHFPASRIVLVDSAPDEEALSRFPDHVLVPADQASTAMRQIVPFSDRYGKTLPVSGGDYWLATAWWTAYAAQRMARWQAEEIGVDQPIAYLIQDYEPGFYPWSSQYALASGTYRPHVDVGIFNTGLLADFFASQGLRYDRTYAFEPELNAGLREALALARAANGEKARRRQVVVYARPGTPRNAFELICEGIRLWGWRDNRAATWSFLAAGELESDIDLGPVRLQALGKLGIDQYGELLATSAVGVSLMVSPHPSYPPLEMAAFGMSVLTNRYANKDLGASMPNVLSLDEMSPEAISAGLTRLMDVFEARGMMANPVLDEGASLLHSGGLAAAAADAARAWGLA